MKSSRLDNLLWQIKSATMLRVEHHREWTAKGSEAEYCDMLIYHPYNWNSSNALKEGWE